jgi:jumonji domain-containing protein 2
LQEDADLFSINYLHMGAPKVWYCVSPKDRGKFERMCQSMFPELHSHCHAFLRHKDILLSPSTLKNYGVEYMQVRATLMLSSVTDMLCLYEYKRMIADGCAVV